MKLDKTSENSIEQNKSHKIYAPMEQMSSNKEIPRRYFGDSSQLTNCTLDSGAMCHMTPKISIFCTKNTGRNGQKH